VARARFSTWAAVPDPAGGELGDWRREGRPLLNCQLIALSEIPSISQIFADPIVSNSDIERGY